jgi:hypothetical protein
VNASPCARAASQRSADIDDDHGADKVTTCGFVRRPCRQAARAQVPSPTVAANNDGWRTWLRGQLDLRRWRPADLVRAGEGRLESSQVTRWLRSDQAPSFDSVRAVCLALKVPVVEGLLAAGMVDPGEVGATVVVAERPIEDLGDRTLIEELARRLAQVAANSAVRGGDVPLEWSKTDAPSRQSASRGQAKRA